MRDAGVATVSALGEPWAFPDGWDKPTITAEGAFIVATNTGGVITGLGTYQVAIAVVSSWSRNLLTREVKGKI